MPIRNLLHYLKKYDIILSWNAFHREFQKYKTADRFTIQISFVLMYGTGIISKKCIMIIIQRGDCYEITHFYRDRCAAPCRIVRNGDAESDSRYAEWSCILALRWRSAPWKRWSKQRFRSICMPGRAGNSCCLTVRQIPQTVKCGNLFRREHHWPDENICTWVRYIFCFLKSEYRLLHTGKGQRLKKHWLYVG